MQAAGAGLVFLLLKFCGERGKHLISGYSSEKWVLVHLLPLSVIYTAQLMKAYLGSEI